MPFPQNPSIVDLATISLAPTHQLEIPAKYDDIIIKAVNTTNMTTILIPILLSIPVSSDFPNELIFLFTPLHYVTVEIVN